MYPESSKYGEYERPPAIDLLQLLNSVRRRLWLVAVITLGMTLLAAVYALQITDRYASAAQLELRPPALGVLETEQQQSEYKTATFIETQIEILRSKEIMHRVVDSLDLARLPEFNDRFRKPVRFMAAYAADDGALANLDAVTPLETAKAVQRLIQRISTERLGKSHLVTISALSENPVRAAQIVNAVIDSYLQFDLETRLSDYRNTNSWLKAEIIRTRSRLDEAEKDVELFKQKHRLAQSAQGTASDKQLAELTYQLAVARADLAEDEARFRQVTVLIENGESAETIGKAMASQVLADLREQHSILVQKRADYSTKYGRRHPVYVSLQSEIADIEKQIQTEVKRNVASLKNDLEIARSRVASLEESVQSFETIELVNESALSDLAELEGRAETERRLLNNLLEGSRQSMVMAGQSSFEPIARKISDASVPDSPSEPNRKVLVLLAFVGSGTFALGFVLLLGTVDETFSTGKELQHKLGLMNLATVPHVPQLAGQRGTRAMGIRNHLVLRKRSHFSEAFRLAQANLVLLDVEDPPKTVMLASALPNEGKSTSAFCLAQTAAIGGVRTLLIDADFRNPSLSAALVNNVSMGFAEVLTGSCSVDDAIVKERESGLDILPLKEPVYAQPHWLNGIAVRDFLEQLKEKYDFIVMDSAPILPVGDSPILARWADVTVLVVKWESTPLSAIASATEKVELAGCPRVAALMTQADLSRIRSYGYGDDAYYASRYDPKERNPVVHSPRLPKWVKERLKISIRRQKQRSIGRPNTERKQSDAS